MPELRGTTHHDACLLSDRLPPPMPFHENTTGGARLARLAARFQKETA